MFVLGLIVGVGATYAVLHFFPNLVGATKSAEALVKAEVEKVVALLKATK